MVKQVVLSRAWGLTVKEAKRIAAMVGAGSVQFVPAIARGGGQRLASVRMRDQRGARFCFTDRQREVAG